jgi:hypothetical protein
MSDPGRPAEVLAIMITDVGGLGRASADPRRSGHRRDLEIARSDRPWSPRPGAGAGGAPNGVALPAT